MDAALEVLIPANTIVKGLKFEVPYFEWDGNKHAQGLPQSKFGPYFELREMEHYDYELTLRQLPDYYKAFEWKAISIEGEGLDKYVASLFDLDKEDDIYNLKTLIESLLEGVSNWLLIYAPQYDGFSKVIPGDTDIALDYLKREIKSSSSGFLIYH